MKKFETTFGLPIKEVYTQEDLKDFDPERDLGLPGNPPFTRVYIQICTGEGYGQ
jgi:methylmalonyl-CoA mutase (EC 5.4.99.2)